jgi:hypothetical protein
VIGAQSMLVLTYDRGRIQAINADTSSMPTREMQEAVDIVVQVEVSFQTKGSLQESIQAASEVLRCGKAAPPRALGPQFWLPMVVIGNTFKAVIAYATLCQGPTRRRGVAFGVCT